MSLGHIYYYNINIRLINQINKILYNVYELSYLTINILIN